MIVMLQSWVLDVVDNNKRESLNTFQQVKEVKPRVLERCVSVCERENTSDRVLDYCAYCVCMR